MPPRSRREVLAAQNAVAVRQSLRKTIIREYRFCRQRLVVRVGFPVEVRPDEWLVAYRLGDAKPRHIHHADGLAALLATIGMVQQDLVLHAGKYFPALIREWGPMLGLEVPIY